MLERSHSHLLVAAYEGMLEAIEQTFAESLQQLCPGLLCWYIVVEKGRMADSKRCNLMIYA